MKVSELLDIIEAYDMDDDAEIIIYTPYARAAEHKKAVNVDYKNAWEILWTLELHQMGINEDDNVLLIYG